MRPEHLRVETPMPAIRFSDKSIAPGLETITTMLGLLIRGRFEE